MSQGREPEGSGLSFPTRAAGSGGGQACAARQRGRAAAVSAARAPPRAPGLRPRTRVGRRCPRGGGKEALRCFPGASICPRVFRPEPSRLPAGAGDAESDACGDRAAGGPQGAGRKDEERLPGPCAAARGGRVGRREGAPGAEVRSCRPSRGRARECGQGGGTEGRGARARRPTRLATPLPGWRGSVPAGPA